MKYFILVAILISVFIVLTVEPRKPATKIQIPPRDQTSEQLRQYFDKLLFGKGLK